MCRLGNIPPYLAGINIGSYAYTTSKGAREDLYLFAARQYMDCIAQTLSMNNVLPRGTYIEFDVDDYLADVIAETESPDVQEMPITQPATTAPSEVMQ
jgi:hypothetical protein